MVRARNRDRKRKYKSSDDSDDDDYMVEEDEVSDGGDDLEDYYSSSEIDGGDDKKDITSKPKRGFLSTWGNEGKRSRNRKRVLYIKEKDNVDLDGGDYDDDDDEFRPDALDGLDEEEGKTTKRRWVACKEEKDVVDDEEEEEYDFNDDDKVKWDDDKKAVTSKPKRGSLKRHGNEDKVSRNRKRVSYSEEKDDVDLDDDGDEEFRPDGVDGLSGDEGRTVKRRRTACKEEKDGKDEDEEEEYDFNDDEDNEEDYDFDDEEFTDEVDSIDEDEDVRVTKRVKRPAERRGLRKVNVQRKKRSRRGTKRITRKNANSRSQVRNCDGDGFFTKKAPIMIQESKKKTHIRRKKRSVLQSDSDFVSSGASDCNFTISEEEREQVNASRICRPTTVSLRSSSSSKKVEKNIELKQPRKPPIRKGKEKVEPVKNDVAKQVCGICLSEEGKRTVRGTLDCCSHYFCFACIMEWSKVESRCPLCKQRFVTISKPARSNAGIDLRDVVTQVPQRDQIYQPSEEEIRGYLDPYENVMCTECQLGGDDNLMLLCDICDSPAHTYCVGLGREVPEGNWYCEGCRPVALASLMSQHHLPDQRPVDINTFHRLSTSANTEYNMEPATLPSPYSQGGVAGLTSPRYPFMDGLTSPRSGAGVSTVSGRRHIQRQVHSMRARNGNGRFDNNFGASLGSDYPEFQADQGTIPYQLPRTPVAGTSYDNVFSHPSTVQDGRIFPARSINNNTRHVTQEPGFTASDLHELGQLQHARHYHYSNGSNMDPDWNSSFSAKGIVQSMVESYLESISRNMVLDQDISVIAKRSTQTVLAACGFEHETSEVCLIQPQIFPKCRHDERQTSILMRGCCSACFESFVRQVAKAIWNEHCPGFLWVRD